MVVHRDRDHVVYSASFTQPRSTSSRDFAISLSSSSVSLTNCLREVLLGYSTMKDFTLAEACDRLERAVRGLTSRTCLKECRCLHRNDPDIKVQPRILKLEEVEQPLAYIRMIQWNTSLVKYYPTLERDLVILLFSCIDYVDLARDGRRDWDQEVRTGGYMAYGNDNALLNEWNENLEKVLNALSNLEQRMRQRFERSSV
jgi:hypothetical protein